MGAVCKYPIAIQPDDSMTVWSSVRFPRAGERTCVIRYQPRLAKYLDYFIGHECGHIDRFYSACSEDRVLPAIRSDSLQTLAAQVKAEIPRLLANMPVARHNAFLDFLCTSLIRQVTNTPADCRIEVWMSKTLPGLQDVQGAALRELYGTFLQCLSPRVQQVTPSSIYEWSNATNYPLVKTFSQLLKEPALLTPYLEAGFEELGERLGLHLAAADQGYLDDRRIADAWADEVGLRGCYEWRPLD